MFTNLKIIGLLRSAIDRIQGNVLPECPKCGGNLDTKMVHGVWVDECPRCLGVWFDANEFDQIKSKVDENVGWIKINFWEHADRSNFNASKVDCPKCQTLMSEIIFDTSGVRIEFCINCGGTWFDRGEDKMLINFLKGNELSRVA